MNLRSEAADDRVEAESPATPSAESDPSRRRRAEAKPQDAEPSTDDGKQETKPGRLATLRHHPIVVAVATVAIIAIAVGTLIWWLQARHFESTDDAFIDARTAALSAQVSGAIVDVPVTDNQLVDSGTVLVRIDDRDYQANLDQANAQVDEAQAGVANIAAQIGEQQPKIDQANEQVAEAQGALTFSQQQNARYSELAKNGSGSQQQAQQASSDLRQKEAAYKAAQAAAVAAQKQMDVLKAQQENAAGQLAQARATQEQAKINLARTVITAPMDGRITKLSAAKGAYAQVGQALTMFVPREIWVTANFKETQLVDMRPGQPVDITVDAYPDRTIKAHVDSIQAGSGTAFSLLPAENATGNYVKVVQRVPVKIVFDQPPDLLLGPGMSVEPYVRVR